MEEKAPPKSSILQLGAVLALLASFIIVITYLVPQISSIKDGSNRAAAKEQELEAGKKKIQTIKTAVQLIASAKKDIETLGISMPAKAKAEEAVVQVASAASQAGAAVKSITVGDTKGGKVLLSFSTEGKFDQYTTFLDNLEKNLRPMKISDYNMTLNQNDQSLVDSTFNIEFPYVDTEATATPVSAEGAATKEAQ